MADSKPMHPRALIRHAVVRVLKENPATAALLSDRVYPDRVEHWLAEELPACGVYTLSEETLNSGYHLFQERLGGKTDHRAGRPRLFLAAFQRIWPAYGLCAGAVRRNLQPGNSGLGKSQAEAQPLLGLRSWRWLGPGNWNCATADHRPRINRRRKGGKRLPCRLCP